MRSGPRTFRSALAAASIASVVAGTVQAQLPPAPAGEAAPAPPAPQRRCPAPASASADTVRPLQEAADRARVEADTPIDVASDRAILDVDGDATLTGNVRVRQGEREIVADEVEYDANRSRFEVRGSVEYRDSVVRAKGGTGTYSASEGASFEGAEFELVQRVARGAARDMRLDTSGLISLDGVRFSTCPADDEAWRIRAQRIDLDTRGRTGTGRNAAVEFKGVPLFYLPYISFPLGNERKSGFLFPSIGHSSRSGVQFSPPYYWNIAPQLDLTLQPTIYGRRGVDVAGDFRYLTRSSKGTASASVLPSDRIADRDRHWLQWLHRSELPSGWLLTIDAQDVSDSRYFEDFAQGAEGASTAFLDRMLRVSYRDEHWRLHGEIQSLQTIDRNLAFDERPYAQLPRLFVSGTSGIGGERLLRAGIDAELVNFERSIGVTGWRFDAEPTLSVDFERPGYFLRPTLGYRYTRYRLEDVAPGTDDAPERSMPFASLDAGLRLERLSGSREQRRITLEPRALYLYTPFRDQSTLPVFDTGIPDLINFIQLFRNNRYVGADRFGDANQLSLGLQSALYDANDGRRFIAATVGQTYYFEQPRVLLPGEAPRRRGASDLIAQLALTAYKDWNIELATQWNPDETREERSQARIQYAPSADQIVNLIYRSQRDRLEQAEFSLAWPVGQRWNLFSRWVYDLQANQTNDRFVGLEYKACCWRLRAIARRFVSSRIGEQETGIYLQLELNGLASVGSSADTFLEGAVRGYSRSAASP